MAEFVTNVITDGENVGESITYHKSHRYPPGIFVWISRQKTPTIPRIVFARCCGQIGRLVDGHVHTPAPCDGSFVKVSDTHSGSIAYTRLSKTQAFKHGGGVAHWTCCGQDAVPAWQAAWDGIGRMPGDGWLKPCTASSSPPSSVDRYSIFETSQLKAVGGFSTWARAPAPAPRAASPVPAVRWPAAVSDMARLKAALEADPEFSDLVRSWKAEPKTPLVVYPAPPISPFVEKILQEFGLRDLVHNPEVREGLWLKSAGGWGYAEITALLGDNLLAFVVTGKLLESMPKHLVGSITERKKDYTSNEALYHAISKLVGAANASMSPREHATLFEALLGTVHKVKGLPAVEAIVTKLMELLDEEYDNDRLPRTNVTASPLMLLDQLASKAGIVRPDIRVIQQQDSPSSPPQFLALFESVPHKSDEVIWSVSSKWESSKAEARRQLARRALAVLGVSV